MADLIDRAALFTDINDREAFIVIGAGDNICIDIADINKAPTIEAKPVVHGEWEDYSAIKGMARCSECHDTYIYRAWVDEGKWYYCPNCGAKMDGEREENG